MKVFLPSVYGGTGPAAQADTPQQALDLLALIKAHPQQRRASYTVNALLMQVAQARAEDMSRRDYFSHVTPEGLGPNYFVRKAGYPLPTWYGVELHSNQVESIHAGGVDAAMVVDGWQHSPSHSVHMLGLIDFYANQIDVGAGYAMRAGTVYGTYWCFISAMQGDT